jgi:hypothetical protein
LRVIGSSGRSRARFTPRVPAAGGLELVGVGVAISHRSTCRWLRRGGMDRWRNHRQRHGYFPCGIAHLLSTANRLHGGIQRPPYSLRSARDLNGLHARGGRIPQAAPRFTRSAVGARRRARS